jgi:hypothetical protein
MAVYQRENMIFSSWAVDVRGQMDFTLTELERELVELGRAYAEREVAAVAPQA